MNIVDNAKRLAPKDRAIHGPLDYSEGVDIKPYVSFGGIMIPPTPDLTISLQVDEDSNTPIAIELQLADSQLLLQAFAARKTSGLWAQVQEESIAQVSEQGGKVDVTTGELGQQLDVYAQSTDKVPSSRHYGVDGPRWFLRGVLGGKALSDATAEQTMIDLFRSVIVHRGSAPMPPRDLIPLQIPGQSNQLAEA